jgi:hypothetical protein
MPGRAPVPERRLIDFADPARRGDWETVDDVVMGGVSHSELCGTGSGTALFRGTVSLENHGGFASARTRPERFELAGWDGLALHLRGDGHVYKLQMRTDDAFDGIVYQARFATEAGNWQTVRLAFADFAPTFRGRVSRGAPPLDPGAVRRIGLLISDKQPGPFELEIAWIGAYAGPAPAGTSDDEGGHSP